MRKLYRTMFVDIPAGSGKTKSIIELSKTKPIVIVVPTVKLMKEYKDDILTISSYGEYGNIQDIIKDNVGKRSIMITHEAYFRYFKIIKKAGVPIYMDEVPDFVHTFSLLPSETWYYHKSWRWLRRNGMGDMIRDELKEILKKVESGGYIRYDRDYIDIKPLIAVVIFDTSEVDMDDFIPVYDGVYLTTIDNKAKYNGKSIMINRERFTLVKRIEPFYPNNDPKTPTWHRIVLDPRMFDGITILSARFKESYFFDFYKKSIEFVESDELNVVTYVPDNEVVIHYYDDDRKTSKTKLLNDESALTFNLIKSSGCELNMVHNQAFSDVSGIIRIRNACDLARKKQSLMSLASHGLNQFRGTHSIGVFLAIRQDPSMGTEVRPTEEQIIKIENDCIYQGVMRTALRDRDDHDTVHIYLYSKDQAKRLRYILSEEIGIRKVLMVKEELL